MDIHGQHARSVPQKLFLAANHLAAVAVTAWLLFGGGFNALSRWSGITLQTGDPARRALLLGAAVVYFTRLIGTGYLLSRKVSWGESLLVSAWLYVLYGVLIFLGGRDMAPIGPGAIAGGVLYVGGSSLNTVAEYQRYRWKRRAENRGGLYTGGLFRWSMHVNYLGDSILFTGFALMTGSPWALLVPVAMVAMFLGYHIPTLDAYLARRYGAAFEAYARRTPKFLPGIYRRL